MKQRYRIYATVLLLSASSISRATPAIDQLLTNAVAVMQTDIDHAQGLIEEALEVAPENPEAHFLCGRIMGRQAADAIFSALYYAGKSLGCLKRAVALAPQEVSYRHGLVRFYLGAPSIAGGSQSLAKEEVEQIRRLDEIEGAKAELYVLAETNQHSNRLVRLEQLRQDFPGVAYFHYHYGLLLQQSQRYDAAAAAFIQALLSADGGHQVGWFDARWHLPAQHVEFGVLINALYQVGRNAALSGINVDQGIKALLQYCETVLSHHSAPPVEWAYLRLAQLYTMQDDPAKAEAYLALARRSDDPDLQKAAREIDRYQR